MTKQDFINKVAAKSGLSARDAGKAVDAFNSLEIEGRVAEGSRWLKGKYDKPLYAVVEETCASAAYYIAAAADEIFVDKASIVGSIGVLMDGFGFTGLMGWLGNRA